MEEQVTSVADDEDFGLFGAMDIEDIPDDPWFVGQGWYQATVTKSVRHTKKDSSGYAWIIQYTIDEPESQYHGFTKGDWFDLHLQPGMKFKDLKAEEQQAVIRMKNRIMEAFDKTEAEASRFKPDHAMGEVVFLKVVERQGKGEHEGKTFSNLEKVVSKRKYEEENSGQTSGSMESVGLTGL